MPTLLPAEVANNASFLPAAAPLAATSSGALCATAAAAQIVTLLLADKRSPATRLAYEADLRIFFGGALDQETVHGFVALAPPLLAARLALFKAEQLGQGLSEATVNRRLSAVRSLLKFAFRLGLSQSDGRNLVDGEKVSAYRDTRGVDVKTVAKLLKLPGLTTLKGVRDTALLRLLFENALRRGEVVKLNLGDFEARERRLFILGKGKGTQRLPVTLSPKCAGAISAYLAASGHGGEAPTLPLFRSLDRSQQASAGISANGLAVVVEEYGKRLNVKISPHRIRHSGITAALDATGGDVRRVQKLSRHANIATVMVYDDSRADFQGEVTGLLSKLV